MVTCNISYGDWYNETGCKIEEEIQTWLDECPSSFIEKDIDMQDILDSEFESLVGELQDRAYEEYRESGILNANHS